MLDLIYAGNEQQKCQEIVRKKFPQCIIEDDSDDIHEGRFSVELEISDEDWYRFLIIEGIAVLSFHFGLSSGTTEGRLLISKLMHENLVLNKNFEVV